MAVNSNALAMLRELNIRKARESLWAYCVITSPEFYKADRWHLWIYCEVLQALYERRLTKSFFLGLCRSPNVPKWYEKWYGEEVGFDRLKDNQNFTYLMTNMAPRMGKCIAKGSLVTMSDGTVKKIEDIKQGEYVKSINEENFSIVNSRITNTFDNGIKKTLKITLSSGKSVICTENHPIYTFCGWTSAIELKIDTDVLVFEKNDTKFEKVCSIKRNGLQQTYDIEVENTHNFMVDNVIVHNSRTLVKFCDWILGKSNKNKIISVSYNDDLAEDSSRYVRDGILERKNLPMDIVFADVFPDATIKADNKSLKKWALDGCFFSYMGAGLNGTITGKGGNCLDGDTLILTNYGQVSIRFITNNYRKLDIHVMSLNLKNFTLEESKVVNAKIVNCNEKCTITIDDGRKIVSTLEHRFYVTCSKKNCEHDKHYVKAKDLQIGDFLYSYTGGTLEKIAKIEFEVEEKSKFYYDIEVDNRLHNYFANGILCHNCTIIDDPIKNDKEALNDTVLQGIWDWYTGTFLSRAEETDGGSINIINHTRWNTKDLCGRLLADDDFKNLWFVLAFPVEYNGEMLCEGILPKKKFEVLRKVTEKNVVSSCIFKANYYQHPIDIKGRLFTEIKTYDVLPDGIERFIAYCDTADTGDDYLCAIMGGVLNGEGYVTDVLFTKDPMIKTEKELPRLLVVNKITDALIESNSGGKNFARSVEKNLWELYKIRDCRIRWFHQSENKQSRILSGAPYVMEHIYFPTNWKDRFPEFYNHIITYQSTGKNEHDDGAEALVEFGKMIVGQNSVSSYIEWMKQLKEKRKH